MFHVLQGTILCLLLIKRRAYTNCEVTAWDHVFLDEKSKSGPDTSKLAMERVKFIALNFVTVFRPRADVSGARWASLVPHCCTILGADADTSGRQFEEKVRPGAP